MNSYREKLDSLRREGMLRVLQPLADRNGAMISRDGRPMVNLSSNDYLGLAGDRQLLESFYRGRTVEHSHDDFALGVASSRLLTGDLPIAHRLEELLCNLYGAEGALLFNSGYHANIGIIPALYSKNDLVLSDKLNHASLHDGLRLCRADFQRYRHCDYDHLRALLEQQRHRYEQCLIVTESVFSMDGDCADLAALVELKKAYDCQLYVDEAHAVGLYGAQGLGQAEAAACLADIDLLVGTFGKACGSVGAFLICTADIRDYLINHSRSLIFTTGLPPVVLNWNHFVMSRIAGMADRRAHLAKISDLLRNGIRDAGLPTAGQTNIVPLIIGSAELAVKGAEFLQSHGFLVLPVRPPTVPRNSSRFRFSLTADLQWQQVEQLPALIRDWLAGQL